MEFDGGNLQTMESQNGKECPTACQQNYSRAADIEFL
jgi:hypothetical protein